LFERTHNSKPTSTFLQSTRLTDTAIPTCWIAVLKVKNTQTHISLSSTFHSPLICSHNVPRKPESHRTDDHTPPNW